MNFLFKFFFALSFISLSLQAQVSDTSNFNYSEIRGLLLDAETKDPLPYANIVIQRINKGTISNEVGEFQMDTLNVLSTDSISFQYIGYKTTTYLIKDVLKMKTVLLEEDIQNLNKVFVFGAPPNPKDIIKKVVENRAKNYANSRNKSNVFFRYRNTEDVDNLEMEYKKSTISVLDEKMIKELERKTPRHSTSYTDLLADIYYSPIAIDSTKYKLSPIKTVSLKEKEIADMKMIESVFKEVFADTKDDEYWKLKTGALSGEMTVDGVDSTDSDRPKNGRKTKSSFYPIKNAVKYGQLTDEDDWEFLHATGKYKYKLVGGTNVGSEDVYIIDFTPKSGGTFIGRAYISVETYALIRADYAYDIGKTGTDIQILGIGYRQDVFTGSVLFAKQDSTYNLVYCSKKTGEKISIKRKFSILKKRERFMWDKTIKEIKLGINIKMNAQNSFELLVLNNEPISANSFKSFNQNKYHIVNYVDQFDDTLWEGYSIIQPTKKMREYKKRGE